MRKLGYYLGHILVGLALAQFLHQQSNFTMAIALVLILVHAFIIFHGMKDQFLFMLYMFSLCFLFTNDIFGGITLIPLLVLLVSAFSPGVLKIKNGFIKTCIYILVLTNFAGYLLINQTGMSNIIQSAIIFTGMMLMFIFIQNYKFKKQHGKIILNVLTFISVLSFLVAFNQKYVILDSSLPLLGAIKYPSVSIVGGMYYGRFPSLLGDYELFAEYSLLFFIIAFFIIMDEKVTSYFKLGISPYILLGSSFLCILMTGTRSGFLLVIAYIALFSTLRFRIFASSALLKVFVLIIIAMPLLFVFGDIIGLNEIIYRLGQINLDNIRLESIRSGEEMNRSLVYARGYQRLAEENWFIGYGFGRGFGNHWAWYGSPFEGQLDRITDFHSLYLSLPMIYGLIGGGAYLSIIVYIIIISFKRYSTSRNNPLRGIFIGFSFLFVFFLIDQIKINSMRYYNYHFLIWIIMGFALSIINSKIKIDNESIMDD